MTEVIEGYQLALKKAHELLPGKREYRLQNTTWTTEIYRDNLVSTMAADAMAPCIIRSSATMVVTTDTAKLTGSRTLADKRWVGPVKLLCVIMFDISKIRPKSILSLVKAQKFSQCLWLSRINMSLSSTRRDSFQLSKPSQCEKMIENTNVFYVS